MELPTKEESLEMLRDSGNPANIIEHCMKVNDVANYVASMLRDSGVDIDLEVVDRASLLHDVAKYKAIEANGDVKHGNEGYKILKEAGYPALGKIIKKHALDEILVGGIKTWEEKVVYYADKRVNGDKVVSLAERFNYLRGKYGKVSMGILMLINTCEPAVYRLEREIFKQIGTNVRLEGI
ncbi:MAG: HD domain-containing protein [Candidatus Diapherotrites archaeon]|nr:HDIG domain-containing protein [Candidatus Micrarchaeota archaeon]MBU1939584.1 HDIG domain-containing protein [Candidatus Micrarchaeota archaeon]